MANAMRAWLIFDSGKARWLLAARVAKAQVETVIAGFSRDNRPPRLSGCTEPQVPE